MYMDSFELGPIRPPSEAFSLLLRLTRNCPWNRCKFCHIYKGSKFELRSVDELKQEILTARRIRDSIDEIARQPGNGRVVQDIAAALASNPPSEGYRNVALWLYGGGETVFLQDANTLIMRTPDLLEVLLFLKNTLPGIKRITSYARSKTAAKKTVEELKQLHKAGLSRLHIGLESGYDPLLELMDKGVTAAEHIKGGKNVVASGISLSEYVLLGLGGDKMWREHALETARVLSEIDPDFIRVRTLTINNQMPLYDEIQAGNFIRATDETIVAEERLLIENLDCHSNFVSDHITNLLQEIDGKLPQDKERMLEIIDRFQALSPEEQTNFKVGRRAGIYNGLDDLADTKRHEIADRMVNRIRQGSEPLDDILYAMMERFI
ncbi:radical SAM protein [Chloroflexota bacterium]